MAVWVLGPDGDYVYVVAKKSTRLVATKQKSFAIWGLCWRNSINPSFPNYPHFPVLFWGKTARLPSFPSRYLAAHGAAIVHTGAHQIYGSAHPADEDRRLACGMCQKLGDAYGDFMAILWLFFGDLMIYW